MYSSAPVTWPEWTVARFPLSLRPLPQEYVPMCPSVGRSSKTIDQPGGIVVTETPVLGAPVATKLAQVYTCHRNLFVAIATLHFSFSVSAHNVQHFTPEIPPNSPLVCLKRALYLLLLSLPIPHTGCTCTVAQRGLLRPNLLYTDTNMDLTSRTQTRCKRRTRNQYLLMHANLVCGPLAIFS